MQILKFWQPESGLIGGMIFGLVIILLALFLFPIIIKGYQLWSKYLGV